MWFFIGLILGIMVGSRRIRTTLQEASSRFLER